MLHWFQLESVFLHIHVSIIKSTFHFNVTGPMLPLPMEVHDMWKFVDAFCETCCQPSTIKYLPLTPKKLSVNSTYPQKV